MLRDIKFLFIFKKNLSKRILLESCFLVQWLGLCDQIWKVGGFGEITKLDYRKKFADAPRRTFNNLRGYQDPLMSVLVQSAGPGVSLRMPNFLTSFFFSPVESSPKPAPLNEGKNQEQIRF